MSNLVGIWMQEIAKLVKKQASAGSCDSESGGRGCTREQRQQKEDLVSAKKNGIQAKEKREVILSDATLCMLLDRFAPG